MKAIFFLFWKRWFSEQSFPCCDVGHQCCPNRTEKCRSQEVNADRLTTSGAKWQYNDFSHILTFKRPQRVLLLHILWSHLSFYQRQYMFKTLNNIFPLCQRTKIFTNCSLYLVGNSHGSQWKKESWHSPRSLVHLLPWKQHTVGISRYMCLPSSAKNNQCRKSSQVIYILLGIFLWCHLKFIILQLRLCKEEGFLQIHILQLERKSEGQDMKEQHFAWGKALWQLCERSGLSLKKV